MKFRVIGFYVIVHWTLALAAGGQVLLHNVPVTDPAFSGSPVLDLSDATQARKNATVDSRDVALAQLFDNKVLPPLYDEAHPEKSGNIHYLGHAGYHNYDPLPTKYADIVSIGTINDAAVHLSAHKNRVYSVFAFQVERILKSNKKNLANVLQIEREGGLVRFPSGKIRFEGDAGEGLPVKGHRYLLFLRAAPDNSSFIVIGGFALGESRIQALDVAARKVESETEARLVAQIVAQVKK